MRENSRMKVMLRALLLSLLFLFLLAPAVKAQDKVEIKIATPGSEDEGNDQDRSPMFVLGAELWGIYDGVYLLSLEKRISRFFALEAGAGYTSHSTYKYEGIGGRDENFLRNSEARRGIAFRLGAKKILGDPTKYPSRLYIAAEVRYSEYKYVYTQPSNAVNKGQQSNVTDVYVNLVPLFGSRVNLIRNRLLLDLYMGPRIGYFKEADVNYFTKRINSWETEYYYDLMENTGVSIGFTFGTKLSIAI